MHVGCTKEQFQQFPISTQIELVRTILIRAFYVWLNIKLSHILIYLRRINNFVLDRDYSYERKYNEILWKALKRIQQ